MTKILFANVELLEYITTHCTFNINQPMKYTADQVRGKPPPPPVQTVRHKDGTMQNLYIAEVIASPMWALEVNAD